MVSSSRSVLAAPLLVAAVRATNCSMYHVADGVVAADVIAPEAVAAADVAVVAVMVVAVFAVVVPAHPALSRTGLRISIRTSGCGTGNPLQAPAPDPCSSTTGFVMYFLLVLAMRTANFSPIGFQGTPMKVFCFFTAPLVLTWLPAVQTGEVDSRRVADDDHVAFVISLQEDAR